MKPISILSVSVDPTSLEDFCAWCERELTRDDRAQSKQVVTVNPEFIMEAQRNKKFRDVINEGALRLVDGFGIVCAAKFLFGPALPVPRVTGVSSVWMLAEMCAKTNRKMYLLGAGSGIAEKTAKVLREKFPALVIAGAEEGLPKKSASGSEHETRAQEIVNRINVSGADVLLVAFGAPKQELWIADNLFRLAGVRIALGVGGSFDYISGAVPYAPAWLRKSGLEWLYRLIQQPHRAGRILTAVIRFPLAVIYWRLTHSTSHITYNT